MSRAYKALPPASELWELFDYKPLTGELVWKNHPRYKSWTGEIAGTIDSRGYKAIEFKIDGIRHRFTGQRVVWKWVTGEDPGAHLQVDHINQNRSDNTFSNLRLTTPEQNSHNRRHRGWVLTPAGKYRVMIGPMDTNRYVGTFDTEAEARAAYEKASKALHGEFSSVR